MAESASSGAGDTGADGTATAERGTPEADARHASNPGEGQSIGIAGADREARIESIIALSHSSRPADVERYKTLQPELEKLIRQADGLSDEEDEEAADEGTADKKGALTADEAADAEKADDEDLPNPDEVPESPDGYAVPDPPAELGERSELDKELIAGAVERFHEAGLSQAQVTAAIEAFDQAQIAAAEQAGEAIDAKAAEGAEQLRADFGKDYEARVDAANSWIRTELGEVLGGDGVKLLLGTLMPDGTPLDSHPAFVKWAERMAAQGDRRGNAEDRREPGTFETDAEARERRVSEIISLSHSPKAADQDRYKALQPELERLVGHRDAQPPQQPQRRPSAVAALTPPQVDKRIAELVALSHSPRPADQAKYADPAVQRELADLIARQHKAKR